VLKQADDSGQGTAIAVLAGSIFLILLLSYHQKERFASAPEPAPVIAEVQGDVMRPGIYLLEGPCATTAQALRAAGGLRFGIPTDVPERTLSRQVQTGELIRIEHQADGVRIGSASMAAAARLALGKKLDINTSTEEELCLVPQMKPELAEYILDRRRERPWRNLQELTQLPGVGSKTIEKWNNYLEAGASE
jgi:competence protein ComEA